MTTRFLHITSLIFIAITLAVMSQSCKSSKQAEQTPVAIGELRNATDAKVELRTILSTYGDWERLRMPVNIRMKSPQNVSISGTAILDRDKSVFISLRFLGFEVANIYATNDSVFVVDKYNKQYAAENISQFLGNTPINISNIQNLLIGRVFMLGERATDADKFGKSEFEITSSNSWMLIPDKQPSGTEYGFAFSPSEVLSATIIKSVNHKPVTITFAAPVKTTNGPVSPSVSVNYNTGKKNLNAELVWSPEKASWNSDVELRQPSITSKYRRITTDQIALMLSKF